MPKCLYIICSESGSEDKATGMASLFNLFEKLQISKAPPNPGVSGPIAQMRVTTLWMRETGDDDKEFEFEISVHPPQAEQIKMGSGKFVFNNPFSRITVRILGMPPLKGEGILWIESRIRRSGQLGWSAHKVPILIEQLPEPAAQIPQSQTEPAELTPNSEG